MKPFFAVVLTITFALNLTAPAFAGQKNCEDFESRVASRNTKAVLIGGGLALAGATFLAFSNPNIDGGSQDEKILLASGILIGGGLWASGKKLRRDCTVPTAAVSERLSPRTLEQTGPIGRSTATIIEREVARTTSSGGAK